MTRLSIETRQRVVRFRDAGYTYKEILQRYLVLALPASQHTTFVCSRGKAGGLANMYSRDHQPFLASIQTRTRETTSPSSRAYQHVLARPPGLPRVHTNTYSRESCESLARLSHERVKLLVSGTVCMQHITKQHGLL